MSLPSACITILDQLSDIIRQLDEKDYARPSAALGNIAVGQHFRHTLEFFTCLEQGFSSGTVNYDKRAHDRLIESDKFIALNLIDRIGDFVKNRTHDVPLILEAGYERDDDQSIKVETNYFRELAYNIEHAVHHMALIKIGLREVAPYVVIPPDFGIAVSTVRHRETSSASR